MRQWHCTLIRFTSSAYNHGSVCIQHMQTQLIREGERTDRILVNNTEPWDPWSRGTAVGLRHSG